MTKQSFFDFIKKYAILTFGSALLAFGITEFLLPNKLAIGGVSGIATVLHFLTNWPMGVLVLLLNIPIFIAGAISEGRKFLAKSLYSTLMLAFFLQIMSNIPVGDYDFLLSALYGGVLSGVGIGIVLLGGGTTGGTDIIAKILQRKFPALSMGLLILITDAIVIAFATIVFRNLNVGLYSTVALFVCSHAIDLIVQGVNFAKAVFIVSDKHDQILDQIHAKMKRGATALYGQGTYSEDEKKVILCTLRSGEVPKLKKLVREVDEGAFIILVDSREVLGEGFARV